MVYTRIKQTITKARYKVFYLSWKLGLSLWRYSHTTDESLLLPRKTERNLGRYPVRKLEKANHFQHVLTTAHTTGNAVLSLQWAVRNFSLLLSPQTLTNVKGKLKNESGFNKKRKWISEFIKKSSTALFEDTRAAKHWNRLAILLPQKVTSRSFAVCRQKLHGAVVCDPNQQKPRKGELWLTCHPELRKGITAPAKAECQLLLFEIPGLDKFVKMSLSLFLFLFSAAPGTTCYLPSLSSVHIS